MFKNNKRPRQEENGFTAIIICTDDKMPQKKLQELLQDTETLLHGRWPQLDVNLYTEDIDDEWIPCLFIHCDMFTIGDNKLLQALGGIGSLIKIIRGGIHDDIDSLQRLYKVQQKWNVQSTSSLEEDVSNKWNQYYKR